MKRTLLVFIPILLLAGIFISLLLGGNGLLFSSMSRCSDVSVGARRACVVSVVRSGLKAGGTQHAYKALKGLYRSDSSISDVCHSLTHEIGGFAYEQFQKNGAIDVSKDFAMCSYGFYHGFMERLAGEPDAAEYAKQFCVLVDEKMKAITPDANLQCYHGIGHGFVNNHDPATWGSDEKLIAPALALCERVSTTISEISRCATGVFNGIATFYNDGLYNLVVNPKDPLWICRIQKKEYQDACYISLNIALLQLTNGDLVAAARFLELITDDMMATHAMINLAAPVGSKNIDTANHDAAIVACRSVSVRLRLPCIAGYAFGMLEHGVPGKEYEKPLAFCGSKGLVPSEREGCFSYIIGYLPQWYPKEKVSEICSRLPSSVQKYCL